MRSILTSAGWSHCHCLHESEQAAGGVALEAAADLGVGLLLGAAAGEVVLGWFVAVDHAPVHDGVEGSVESAVAESVEAVARDSSRGCFERADAGQGCEGGVGSAAAGVGPGDDEVGGADRADAGFSEEGGHGCVDQFAELTFVGADLFV